MGRFKFLGWGFPAGLVCVRRAPRGRSPLSQRLQKLQMLLTRGLVLLGLVGSVGGAPSLYAATLACRELGLGGARYRYTDMNDDPVAVSESLVFSDNLHWLDVNRQRDGLSQLIWQGEGSQLLSDLVISFERSPENGRCRMMVRGMTVGTSEPPENIQAFEEFFEVLGVSGPVSEPDIMWFGDMNAVGGEIYFFLSRERIHN